MSQNGNRPKLELQLNETATVKLLRDKPAIGTSSFGEYHLFSVEHEGQEKSFFAPAEIAQQISDLKLGRGDTFVLQKVAEQNGRKVGSKLVLNVQEKQRESPQASKDNLKDVLLQCVIDAADVVKQSGLQFSMEETQKLSVALLIARTRAY